MTKLYNPFTYLFILQLLVINTANANNIVVSNIGLTNQNITAGTNNELNSINVYFDISWENSWRTNDIQNNWDAAWVFVKYRIGGGQWHHAYLNNTGHTIPLGSSIDIGLKTSNAAFNAFNNPGIGAFLHRSEIGNGTFSLNNVQLQWNYRANSNQLVNDVDNVDIRVFAIEMVYVPQGGFYVGSGAVPVPTYPSAPPGERGGFTDGSWTSGPTIPFQINSENAINIAPNNGSLWGVSFENANTIGEEGVLPDKFPKGFAAFYCMKYEISQQQYADFLNSLTRVQQNTRTGTNLGVGVTSLPTARFVLNNSSSPIYRNGIKCNASLPANDPVYFYCDLNNNGAGGELNDGQWLACNLISYRDVAAFLDWSGLRPMTELEFEKACRGPLNPVPDEYVWGNNDIATELYTLGNPGAIGEYIATNYSLNAGNAIYESTIGPSVSPGEIKGPLRVGVFATENSSRVQTGSSFYGIMELGGNVWERTVTIGNLIGRDFSNISGDGYLSDNGNANEETWPGLENGEVTGAQGSGYRGGGWGWSQYIKISDRVAGSHADISRSRYEGGRGVRTAP